MKSKIIGRILLVVGGVGIIISAVIGSDWPMYACIILSSAGVVILVCSEHRKSVQLDR